MCRCMPPCTLPKMILPFIARGSTMSMDSLHVPVVMGATNVNTICRYYVCSHTVDIIVQYYYHVSGINHGGRHSDLHDFRLIMTLYFQYRIC